MSPCSHRSSNYNFNNAILQQNNASGRNPTTTTTTTGSPVYNITNNHTVNIHGAIDATVTLPQRDGGRREDSQPETMTSPATAMQAYFQPPAAINAESATVGHNDRMRYSIVWAALIISARWALGVMRQAYLRLGNVGDLHTGDGVADVGVMDDDEDQSVPLATRRHY